MTKPAKVSVLVPIFNNARYLGECLDSLNRQELAEMEVLLLDDGSTDASPEIIREFAARDSRMRVVSKENSGYGDTLNIGLGMASGEYVGIVESDDFVEPEMFSLLYDLASRHGADIAKSCFNHCRSDRRRYIAIGEHGHYETTLRPTDHPGLFMKAEAIWAAVYRRAFLLNNNLLFLPTPGASFQDMSFFFKTYAVAEKTVFSAKALLNYRRDNPTSSVKSRDKVFCVCEEYAEIERFFGGDMPPILQGVFHAHRARSYLRTLRRVSPANRRVFLEKASPELLESLSEMGPDGQALLKKRTMRWLRLLKANPSLFLLKCRFHDFYFQARKFLRR